MFSETTLINSDWYIIIGIAISMLLVIILIMTKARWRSMGTKKAKGVFYAILAATIISIASTASFALMVEHQGDRTEYVYTATIGCEGTSGMVYIPVSNNTELQERVHVVSGDGRMSLVDTEHGTAIKLIFNNTVTIQGKLVKDQWLTDWGPTMTDDDQNAWVMLDSPWIYNGTIDLDMTLTENNIPGHDALYYLRSPLKTGWAMYELHHIEE